MDLLSSYGNVGNIYYDLSENASDNKNQRMPIRSSELHPLSENAEEIQLKLVSENPGNEVYEIGLAGTYNNS